MENHVTAVLTCNYWFLKPQWSDEPQCSDSVCLFGVCEPEFPIVVRTVCENYVYLRKCGERAQSSLKTKKIQMLSSS